MIFTILLKKKFFLNYFRKMKKEKYKYIYDKEKKRMIHKDRIHEKNQTEKLEIDLSYPIKINIKQYKNKLNILGLSSSENKISISPKKSILPKERHIISNYINSSKRKKNNNKSQKNSIKKTKNKNNSSLDDINPINKNDNEKEIKNINENSLENENEEIINTKKNNKLKYKIISSSIKNNDNNESKNFTNKNNLNKIYTNEPYNNDLFSNLFIDSSSDNKNILVSELDIELSNMEQSNCNKKNDKIDNHKMNIIDDEEDTNQKSNENINIYKKIELRFKSKLEKSLNKYFKKNGTDFYIGDINKIENHSINKSNNNASKKDINDNKNIKKLINSDGKILHNINFTIDSKESKNNKQINNINSKKLKLMKNKFKENENIKKFQKVILFKTKMFKITNNNNKNNNNIINKNNSKNKIKKEYSTKNRIIKKNKNSPSKTKTILGEKKSKAIYSKIISDANLINENKSKNKFSKEKEKSINNNIKKNDNNNKKNNSTGFRFSYKNSPYYLHSMSSIKSNKKNINNFETSCFKFNYNQLYHHKMKNNILKGEISINSKKNIKNLDEIHSKNNISYLNSKSVKNKNELNKFFSFGLKGENYDTNESHRIKNKIFNKMDLQHKKNDINKKAFKDSNHKMKTNPLNNYKGLNTETKNFNKIKYLNDINKINKKFVLNTRKINNIDNNVELIKKRNMKDKIKSDIYDDNSENNVFCYNKALFLCCSPYKNYKIFPNNSFKNNKDVGV